VSLSLCINAKSRKNISVTQVLSLTDENGFDLDYYSVVLYLGLNSHRIHIGHVTYIRLSSRVDRFLQTASC
jgi:hypothetical protein